MSIKQLIGVWSVMGVLGALGAGAGAAQAAGTGELTYRVEVRNVTAGNVLSPFLAVVHAPQFQVAALGSQASPGVAALAETANRAILTDELSSSGKAYRVASAEGGPLQPGESRALELTVPESALRNGAKLEVLAMIGRSNDSFITLGGVALTRLTGPLGTAVSVSARNYDAGSEENTGNVEDFGHGGHPTEGAEGLISIDRGLNARGNAPDIFGWGSTAAIITVTRLR